MHVIASGSVCKYPYLFKGKADRCVRAHKAEKFACKNEEKSLELGMSIADQSLVPRVANRLLKNLLLRLCQRGRNSLHCAPEPVRGLLKFVESGDADVKA